MSAIDKLLRSIYVSTCGVNNDKIYQENTIVKQILDGDIVGYWGSPTEESYELYIQNLGFDYRSEKPTISLGDDENPQ